MYLAALAGIDPSLYEASRIDGASKWRQLWHVTLPGIRGVIILMLILKLSHILDAGFDQIFMFANTFNQEKIDIIDTWVYREGLERLKIGLFGEKVGRTAIYLILILAYKEVFISHGIGQAYKITLFRTIVGTSLNVLTIIASSGWRSWSFTRKRRIPNT